MKKRTKREQKGKNILRAATRIPKTFKKSTSRKEKKIIIIFLNLEGIYGDG